MNYLEKYYSLERFSLLPDKWIKDNLLGVDWSPISETPLIFEEAEEWGKKRGGELSGIESLVTLINWRSKKRPFMFPIFDIAKSSYYWSSTTYPSNTGHALYVRFGYSNVYYGGDKTYAGYVRAVRRSQ